MAYIDEILEIEEKAQGQVDDTDVGMLDELINTPSTAKQADVNTGLTQDLQPEAEAKVYDLHKRTGYDVPTVRVDPAKVENQDTGYKPGLNSKLDFYMGGSLANGQPNTAISSDDHEALNKVRMTYEASSLWQEPDTETSIGGKISRTITGAKEAFAASSIDVKINELVARRELLGFDPDVVNKQIEALEAQRQEPTVEPEGLVQKIITATSRQLPQQIIGIEHGLEEVPTGIAIAGGAALILGQVPPFTAFPEEALVIPTLTGGAGVGFFAGRTKAMFYQEWGGAYQEYREITDEQGNKIDPSIAKLMATGAASVNAVLENAAFVKVVEALPGGKKLLSKMSSKVVREVVKSKSVLKKLGELAVRLGIAEVTEITTEVMQEISTIIFGEVAKVAQGGEFKELDGEAFKTRIESIIEETALSTAGFLLPGAGVQVGQIALSREASSDFHNDIDKMKEVVDETQTKERSNDHSEEALKAFGVDNPAFISADGITEIYEQSAKPEDVDAILVKVGLNPNKVKADAAVGQDTEIKVAKVLSQLDKEEYNTLKDDIRHDPGAYTRREINDKKAAEEIDNATNVLKEDVEQQKQVDTEILRLTNEIDALKLPDAQIAGDAPLLLRSIYDKLSTSSVDPVQGLRNLTFKRTPFKDFIARGRALFQAPTPTAEALSQEIATLSVRLDKIRPEQQGAADLTSRLEKQLTDTKEKLRATAEASFDVLFQATQKKGVPPRGVLTLEGEKKIIELFEGADLSTVLHEIGHIALLEYTALEQVGNATPELQQDMKTIREWVGAKEGSPLTREQSEQFARGFEAYLLEGKAPTGALRAAFERFKNYLRAVYKSAKALNVTLDKNVRQVFDRMVAANAEAERAAREAGFVAKTDAEMDALGMREVDKFNAKKLIDKTVAKATELLTRARNKSLRLLRGNWHAESREELRDENLTYDIMADIAKSGIDKTELEIIKKAIEDGEPVRRLAKRDKNGDVIGVTVTGGTFPEYFKGQGFTKKGTLNVINKALADKKLTENQTITLNVLVDGFRDDVGREAARVGIEPVFKEDNRFDRAEFVELYGEDAIDDLPNTDIMKKDGIPIDQTAMIYGMESGDVFINRLFNTQPFNEAVDIRVAQKQAAHDATFIVEDYLAGLKSYRDYQALMAQYIKGATVDERAVNDAVQRNIKRWEAEATQTVLDTTGETTSEAAKRNINDIVQDKIAAFREKKAKPKAIQEAELKRLAKETMASKTVKEARNIKSYITAMKKASSDERRAILRKDWGAASTANELGRFNYEMASLSKDIRAEVDKVVANAKRVGKLKAKETIKNEEKEAILHLINRFKLAPLSPRDPQKTPDFSALFMGDSFGRDGFPKPAFLDGNINDYRELRVEQLRELDNAIRYLEGQGRVGKDTTLSDGFTLIEDVGVDATEVLDVMKPKKKWEEGSMMRKLNDKIDDLFAALDSLEFTIKSADNYTNLGKDGIKGVLERYVIDPIKRGLNALSSQQQDIKAQIEPHLAQIQKTNRKWRKQFGRHIQIEGAPLPAAMLGNKQTKGWFDYQIWAVALNTGNTGDKSNYENLKAGYGITDSEVNAIRNMLSAEDMRAVQGIWDAINSLYAQADAQFLKDNNYHLPKIEATPFSFKGVEFEGGYYPIKHDRKLSRQVKERQVKEDFFDNEGGKITTPYTNKGATNARLAGVTLPVRLNLSVIDEHFRDTLHYIHLTDPIRDADRITRYKDDNVNVTQSISDVLGEKVYDTIRPALQHIANPKREGLDTPGASELEWLRGASTAFILAWNTGVALKQPLSTFGAIRDMGVKAYVNGFSSVFMSPVAHYQKMLDLSPRMRERLNSFDRELKSAFLKLTADQKGIYFGDKKVTWQDVKNFGFWQIRVADTVTVLPIWHGAFNDKLNADQSNLLEAVEYADGIVDASQPSARPLDLSEWQRSGGWHRLFSQFQTFTVGKYGQRQRLFYRAWKQGAISKADYAWFNFMDAFVPLVSMNLLFALLQGRDLGDDEEQKKMMIDILAGWLTMGVPVAGSIVRSLSTGWGDPLDTPVLQTGNKLIRGIVAGAKSFDGFENDREMEKAMWGIAHALSIISGLPISKIVQRAIKGAKQKKGVPVIKYLVPAHK